MTFQEVCQHVVSKRESGPEYDSAYGIWRQSWPQDTILGFNDKKGAYANSPAVSVFLDDMITSRAIVFSLSKTEQVSFIGWLPSVDDLSSTDWESNIPYDIGQS